MAPRKGLRARTQVPDTQVPGTPENQSLSGSSLNGPPSPDNHSPSPAPSRLPPPPPPSRPPPRIPPLQSRNSANSAPAPINLGLTDAQKNRLFEIELEKSEHQMRQAAAAADQAERLQQVAEEKAQLEIEYMRKEGDARLAALNARREPATHGTHERARNEEDDDGIAPIQFDDPPPAYLQSVPGSFLVKKLGWCGLTLGTREGYTTATTSYETFCMLRGWKPWPATIEPITEWVAQRIFGGSSPKQGQVQPDTVASYLSGLRSYHIDHHWPVTVFEDLRLARILQGGRSLFPKVKKDRFPITKEILERITATVPISEDDFNIDAAFKIAWAGFLRLGEITYSPADLRKSSFINLKVTRSDVRFAENDQYAVLRLKRSKTDVKHTGVQIILSATGEPTCPVAALRRLFNHVKRPASAPLFMLSNAAFSRVSVISILKSRLAQAGLSETGFSGHSFRKGAAQHASDQGMLDSQIQKLGRWTSNSFQLYFETSSETLFNLNLRFQTGRPLAIPRAVGKPRKTPAPAFP